MVKLRRLYEYWCFESQKDLDDLKDHLGDDLYNDYMKIRDRIPKDQNDYKDFQKLKKLPISNVKDFVDNFQSESERKKEAKKGAKKLYEDSDWLVYKITTYPAAVEYGKGTKWCITGRYPGHEGRGEEYFNNYIDDHDLDGGYYFYLNKKDPSEKFCVLQTKDKKIDSIWDAKDKTKGVEGEKFFNETGVILPKVKEVNIQDIPDKDIIIRRDLHNAISKRDIALMKNILKKNPNMNLEKDPRYLNDPFIYFAILKDVKEAVKLLLDFGVDPNIKNSDGESLLSFADSWDSSQEIIDLLKKYGAKE